MRFVSRRRSVMGAMALLGTLALAGCAPPAPQAPSPTATDAPVFASDAEALAAATEAYAAYLALSDQISREGGADSNRMAALVSKDVLDEELSGFDQFRSAGAHSVGETTFSVAKLQSAEYTTSRRTIISLYICEDVSGVDVLDATGASLVSAERNPITPFEVRFEMSQRSSLVLAERSAWAGETFC
ncbi:hypothetical protein [Cryobacterium sp. HLT2-28]|uniref:hypothetical protein n=1 Tax=Cryobacterium sp. HLT2-28 TaxID=1259146 RepID=UPI00106C5FE2|nr:hypothetical protein [Cryobacterium sp. HLT2-28]TFB92808.1 hypothetical protein E3O48_13735 [Cryobacterium sp. HLT2-28]